MTTANSRLYWGSQNSNMCSSDIDVGSAADKANAAASELLLITDSWLNAAVSSTEHHKCC